MTGPRPTAPRSGRRTVQELMKLSAALRHAGRQASAREQAPPLSSPPREAVPTIDTVGGRRFSSMSTPPMDTMPAALPYDELSHERHMNGTAVPSAVPSATAIAGIEVGTHDELGDARARRATVGLPLIADISSYAPPPRAFTPTSDGFDVPDAARTREDTRRSLAGLREMGILLLDPDEEARLYPTGTTAAEVEELPLTDVPDPDGVARVGGDAPKLVADVRDMDVYFAEPGQGHHQTLSALLQHMERLKATDLHLQIGEQPAFRVDGKIQRISHQAIEIEHMKTFLFGICTNEDLDRLETRSRKADEEISALSADIMAEIDVVYTHLGTRYRVNVAMEEHGVAMAMRRLPTRPPTVQDLHLPPAALDALKLASGLILVSGPTSSGKTTTLAALVNKIAHDEQYHIVTVEDPVEYRYPSGLRSKIMQRQVGRDTHTFANGVKSALRQDPDVIVVGELLDATTTQLALQGAQTGHLVFATIHAGSVEEVPERLVNMFPPQQQPSIAAQLAGVLRLWTFQQLLAKTTGGLMPAIAATPISPAIATNIAEQQWVSLKKSAKEAARVLHGTTLLETLAGMIDKGVVSADEAFSVLVDPDDREQLTNRMRL
jgi:twitching motility protein PilT